MITNFENFTMILNEYEKTVLVPALVSGLKLKVGKDRAVTNSSIVEGLNKHNFNINETKVRKLINYIRIYGLVDCLVATSSGYYVSEDVEEIQSYIKSLSERASAIIHVRDCLKRQLENYRVTLK